MGRTEKERLQTIGRFFNDNTKPTFWRDYNNRRKCPPAADWLSKELANATKAQEMLAHRDAMLQFGVEVAATNSHVKDKENILHSLL